MMEPFVVHGMLSFLVPGTVMIVLGYPIVRLVANRLETKRSAAVVSPEMASRLERIEQAVDSIAIEVERISEAQRFTARLQAGRVEATGARPPDDPSRD